MAIHPQPTLKPNFEMSSTFSSTYNERSPPNLDPSSSSSLAARSKFARFTAFFSLVEFAIVFELSIISTLLSLIFPTIFFKNQINYNKMTSFTDVSIDVLDMDSKPVVETQEIHNKVINMTNEIQISKNESLVRQDPGVKTSIKHEHSITVHGASVKNEAIAIIGNSSISSPVTSHTELVTLPDLEYDIVSHPDYDLDTEIDSNLASEPYIHVVSDTESNPNFRLVSPRPVNTEIVSRALKAIEEELELASQAKAIQEEYEIASHIKYIHKEQERLVDYADLLADSIPDDDKAFTNGRRDLRSSSDFFKDNGYRTQNRQKIKFIEKTLNEVSPVFKDRVLDSFRTAQSITPPSRGPFGLYKEDCFGNIFSSYKGDDWHQVCDLKGLIAPINDNKKYRKESNRLWANEHDSWLNTTAWYADDNVIGNMNKHQWIEARIFSLDADIMRYKMIIAKKENTIKMKKGMDIFGFPIKSKKEKKAAKKFNPQAKEFHPMGKEKVVLNPEAKEFIPAKALHLVYPPIAPDCREVVEYASAFHGLYDEEDIDNTTDHDVACGPVDGCFFIDYVGPNSKVKVKTVERSVPFVKGRHIVLGSKARSIRC
ncbi:hypothetical protein K440DRAFT_638294 [Wilcoxina mikolae CBS 423.85]|nr:hypothetical protein K440DRAFT_638294 [Wilcoxina mikolae CBS 423.85]